MGLKLTQEMVEQWIDRVTGDFYYKEIMDGQVDKTLYGALRMILSRAKEKGLIAPVGKKDGWWRKVDASSQEVAWWDANPVEEDTIILPLEINKYCLIPRPSLIIVAGKYNAGKSCFCLNTVALNQNTHWAGKIDFYVSEGADLIKPRFAQLGITSAPAFRTYRRTENFADVIQKDNLSIVDYLRVDMEQPYAVSQRLFEIFNKVNQGTGIAVVAMQKPPGGRMLAFGGASTAFEPSLYIGMETTGNYTGWIGFEKVKIAKGYGGYDLSKLKIDYRIEYGAKFVDVKERIEYD